MKKKEANILYDAMTAAGDIKRVTGEMHYLCLSSTDTNIREGWIDDGEDKKCPLSRLEAMPAHLYVHFVVSNGRKCQVSMRVQNRKCTCLFRVLNEGVMWS